MKIENAHLKTQFARESVNNTQLRQQLSETSRKAAESKVELLASKRASSMALVNDSGQLDNLRRENEVLSKRYTLLETQFDELQQKAERDVANSQKLAQSVVKKRNQTIRTASRSAAEQRDTDDGHSLKRLQKQNKTLQQELLKLQQNAEEAARERKQAFEELDMEWTAKLEVAELDSKERDQCAAKTIESLQQALVKKSNQVEEKQRSLNRISKAMVDEMATSQVC